ncbi:hypothetical protein A5757_04070 [Mycobacterium sp. 852013-51886_SCH5428379]|uniref:APA family fibronectin-binding glycoprotein n=1 Tax=Mycobacterium sp. 852013-51886_SCH5428379 TaxID=1834111 RepID=UPI0007FBCE63|nr:APA family fibronectin-binding glycoprotein [Mycobacterium sp. 852013-51886_SCH5428379]OBB55676.1 hypothetical protein A5757_04070 [Mycobacterium sp. 852013-51886_SCH5428379]
MNHPDAMSTRRRRLKTLAITAVSSATAAALIMPSVAHAQPAPPPPPPTPTVAPPPAPEPGPPPAPADPNAPPPAPADPNAPPPAPGTPAPADPNAPPAPPAPEPGRVDNASGGFSYVVPEGWQVSDATNLSYGQALLTKVPAEGSTEPPKDTSVLIGRLDLKVFAGAETDNAKAANRLASDMGVYFMPLPGTRVNQQNATLDADGMPGAAHYYEVKFTDTTRPNGQVWAGVVGTPTQPGTPRGQRAPERWFVVWLGSATNPIDTNAATALANSIRPYAPPAAPPPDPNAPPPPPADPNAPPPRPGVGVAVPVAPENAPGMMPPA